MNYEEEKNELLKLINQSCLQQEKFFQHILLVSASILGIVTALHNTHEQCLYIRLIFILSILLLGLGTLITGVVVYFHTLLYEHQKKDYQKELEAAICEMRHLKDVYTEKKKWVIYIEKTSLFLLIGGVFLLMLYVILSSWSISYC